MKKSILITILSILAFSVICYASQIYDSAREAGIGYYNNGQYQLAVQQFVSAQNIAPVNNDLSSWITKCNNQIVNSRNKKKTLTSRNFAGHTRHTNSVTNSAKYVSQKYDSIGHFGDAGLALVRLNNQYGFINRDSLLIIPVQYDDVYSLLEAIPGTADANAQKAWNVKWNWSWDKGQLMSVSKDGKWGYIDASGNVVIPIMYDDVNESIVFKNRPLIGVGKDGKYGFIDWNGKVAIPIIYDIVSRFYLDDKDLAKDIVPVVKDGKMGFINGLGQTVIPFIYEPYYNLSYDAPSLSRPVWFDERTYVKKDGFWGIIDRSGKPIVDFQFDGPAEIRMVSLGRNDNDYNYYETCFEFPKSGDLNYVYDDNVYGSKASLDNEVVLRRVENGFTDAFFDMTDNQRDYMHDWAESNSAYLSDNRKARTLGMLLWSDAGFLNIERAFLLLKQSASSGDKVAQYYFGVMCEWGIVAPNESETVKQKTGLKDVYKHGDTPNYASALKWYRKSASQNYAPAQRKLKELENEGIK